MSKKYCGVGKVPTGQSRGSAEYCVLHNQTRYYGIEPISIEYINKIKKSNKVVNIDKEMIKLIRLRAIYSKNVQLYKRALEIIERAKSPKDEKAAAKKVVADYKKNRQKIRDNYENQSKYVQKIQKEKKEADEKAAKEIKAAKKKEADKKAAAKKPAAKKPAAKKPAAKKPAAKKPAAKKAGGSKTSGKKAANSRNTKKNTSKK